jgi:hypothetical protein
MSVTTLGTVAGRRCLLPVRSASQIHPLLIDHSNAVGAAENGAVRTANVPQACMDGPVYNEEVHLVIRRRDGLPEN